MTRPTALVQFTESLWVVHSRTMEFFNAGAWISEGEALLIDPGVLPDEIEFLAKAVKEHGAEPVALLVTHNHWDHVLGPEHFAGVKVLAQARYPELTQHYADKIKYKVERWERENGVSRDRPFEIPKADEVFGETGEIQIGALRLQLRHVPGHAADQLAVYEAATGTIWTSDILCDTEIPFVSHSLHVYEQTLASLAEVPIKALVPGHGWETKDAANIAARFTEDRAYLAELRERVGEAVRAGKTVEETVAACAGIPYRLREDSEPFHRLNVESCYLELGGAADRNEVGWDRDWRKYARD
jgi:glyoxylase-like metal-dependent hydrolase (beta-lactamase superfamily II)